MAFRIAICDDNPNVRKFLRLILEREKDLNIVAEGESGRDAVEICRTVQPDLLLVDVQMDGPDDGINAISRIRSFDRKVRIIVLTVYSDDEFIINAFRNGADNFILKDIAPEAILKSVMDTLSGKDVLSQLVAGKLKTYVQNSGEKAKTLEENYRRSMKILSMLTKTELEILELLREGFTREEISKEKFIELGTVKTHINRLLKKLKYKRTADAVRELEKIGFFEHLHDSDDRG